MIDFNFLRWIRAVALAFQLRVTFGHTEEKYLCLTTAAMQRTFARLHVIKQNFTPLGLAKYIRLFQRLTFR
ncbi:hypothetical protein F7R12_22735 [Pseudomonas tolaasii]|nr:hypothetical protein B5P22_26005 [Pseudomonas tolaasii]KAB0468877.1 hypothetical protein F7R12_22735 [Pseudomonas tolaasii]